MPGSVKNSGLRLGLVSFKIVHFKIFNFRVLVVPFRYGNFRVLVSSGLCSI